jgi:uncharacterized protein with HEPN domain
MSKRNPESFLLDIKTACERIFEYTGGLNREEFIADYKTVDAVVRNLEIIGEAVKYLPPHLREKRKDIPWKKIIGLRNFLIHEYFGVDELIIWEIINKDLPKLYKAILELIKAEEGF